MQKPENQKIRYFSLHNIYYTTLLIAGQILVF